MLQQAECNNSATERETWSLPRLADAKPPTKRIRPIITLAGINIDTFGSKGNSLLGIYTD